MTTYYIIEHPARGVLRDDSDHGEPRFSWSRSRGDERNMRAFSPVEAHTQLMDYVAPAKLRHECAILRAPTGNDYEWRVMQS